MAVINRIDIADRWRNRLLFRNPSHPTAAICVHLYYKVQDLSFCLHFGLKQRLTCLGINWLSRVSTLRRSLSRAEPRGSV